MGERSSQHPFTLALNILITSMHPPKMNADGQMASITARALAEDIHSATEQPMSSAGLWKLTSGETTNPSLDTLEQLRSYFGLPCLDPLMDPGMAAAYGSELAIINVLKGTHDAPTLELRLRDRLRDGTVGPDAIRALVAAAQRLQAELDSNENE